MSDRWSFNTMLPAGQEPNRMLSAPANAGEWRPWVPIDAGGFRPSYTPRGRGRVPVNTGGWGPSNTPGGRGWEPWATTGGIVNGSLSGSVMLNAFTVVDDDVDVLECSICYRPLKPPIFQCTKGHVVCLRCSNRLKDAVKCHVCRVEMPGSYQRCPNAPYGCNTRTAYHALDEHLMACPHMQCCCPSDACGFAGSVGTLIKHLLVKHGWACTAEAWAGESFGVDLHNGFNFLTAVRGCTYYLLLLNMASTPFGHAISAVWISSLAAMASSSLAPETRNKKCNLQLSYLLDKKDVQRKHYPRSNLISKFHVECRCPSNGLPDPNTSFQFFVPKYIGETGSDEAPVHVTATIMILP